MTTSDELKAGVATRDISPPRPQLLKPTGMARLVPTRGVLDPLRVEALAFEAGGRLAFLTGSDTRTLPYDWVLRIREGVAARTGCDPLCVLLTGVHNHCSNPEAADDSPEALGAFEEASDRMVAGFIDACVEAAERRAPAEIAAATATLTKPVGENRRFRLGNGTCVNTWGSGPAIPPGMKAVGAPGPHSRRVDILAVRRVGETRPFAVFNSYPSHPHLYALPYFSGEFPGAVKRRFERLMPGTTFSQASATGGDIDLHCIHPLPDYHADRVRWFQESAQLLATRFTDDVMPAIPTDGYTRPDRLHHVYWSTEDEMLPGSRRVVILNAIALGQIAMVSMPGEIFLALGQEILTRSPFAYTILGGYNGSARGYVPLPIGFEQGSYETMRGPCLSHEEEARPGRGDVRANEQTGAEIVGELIGILGELHAQQ